MRKFKASKLWTSIICVCVFALNISPVLKIWEIGNDPRKLFELNFLNYRLLLYFFLTGIPVLRIRIRDPVPFWPLHPGSGMVKNQDPGSEMNISDHISESLETIFVLKILKFWCGPVSGITESFRPWIQLDPGCYFSGWFTYYSRFWLASCCWYTGGGGQSRRLGEQKLFRHPLQNWQSQIRRA